MAAHLISPHGGTLVDRLVDAAKAVSLTEKAASLPQITLSSIIGE